MEGSVRTQYMQSEEQPVESSTLKSEVGRARSSIRMSSVADSRDILAKEDFEK